MFVLNYPINQYLEFGLRLVVACLCGAIIGTEREKRYKDAGIRTHVIVCCSAALMMLVSKYGFADLYKSGETLLGTKGVDPSRIAAQVISGVSFIGAGVIFHNRNNTKGLTTASGLWAIAGVGITIGAGMYGIGIFATALIAFIHTFIHKFTSKHNNVYFVKFEMQAVNTKEIRDLIKSYIETNTSGIKEESVSIVDGLISYDITVTMTKCPNTDDVNAFFEKEDNIKSVKFSILN